MRIERRDGYIAINGWDASGYFRPRIAFLKEGLNGDYRSAYIFMSDKAYGAAIACRIMNGKDLDVVVDGLLR